MDLKPIYQQCNDHLKETDKKRDQLLVFFGVVIGIYFTHLSKVTDLAFELSIIISLVGVLLASVLIHYRKWHINYVNAAIVIQKLMFKDVANLRQDELDELWFNSIKPPQIKKFLWSTESLIFNTYLVISFPIVHITIKNIILTDFLKTNWGFGITLLVYLIFFNWKSYQTICKSREEGSKSIWLLRFFD